MILILQILGALILAGIAVVALYISMQAKHKFVFDMKNASKPCITRNDDDKIEFYVDVPMSNEGGDSGIIMDAFMRPYLAQEAYDKVLCRGKINLKDVPRDDDYFEAMIVHKGTKHVMRAKFELTALNGGDLREGIKNLPDFDTVLFWECRGREQIYTIKKYLPIRANELRELLNK